MIKNLGVLLYYHRTTVRGCLGGLLVCLVWLVPLGGSLLVLGGFFVPSSNNKHEATSNKKQRVSRTK